MNPLRNVSEFTGSTEDDYSAWRRAHAAIFMVWMEGAKPKPVHCIYEVEAAEDYAYGEIIDRSTRPDTVNVFVRSPEGVVTRWEVRIHWEPSPIPKQVG